MPFNPLKALQKEVHLCTDCRVPHIVLGHYKWVRHQKMCRVRAANKAKDKRKGRMNQHRWASWENKLKKEKEARKP